MLSANKGTLVTAGFFSFFINIIMLVPPIYMLQVYDRVMASRSEETLLLLTLIVAWMFVTMGILDFARSRMLIRFGARLDDQLNARVCDALGRHALQNPGRTTNQPLNDLMQIRQFLLGNGAFAFFDTPWVPIYLAVLFLFDPLFGWLALLSVIVLLALTLVNEFSTRGSIRKAAEAQVDAFRISDAQIKNAEVLMAMGMRESIHKQWLQKHLQAIKMQSETADRSGLWTGLSKNLRLLFQSMMLGLGAYLAIENHITAGMVIAGSILLGRALAPIDQLIGAWKSFSSARLAYSRLNQLLAQFPEHERRLTLPAPSGALVVEAAVLIPPGGQQPVLKGISLALRAGEMLAVIGNSAAGKTSLVRAMLGVWPLSAGSVRLDGAEIQHWNRDELGPEIGYLPQDVELFDGTIAENIARFGELDPNQIVAAARLAGVDEMIRRLPEGYSTRIGADGAALSGGQRQRIGLARAVYGQPKLVVLDEPNSNLDEKGEWALESACHHLKKRGVTLILVSHRKNILDLADKILMMEEGRMKLFGPKTAVLEELSKVAHQPPARVQPLHLADA